MQNSVNLKKAITEGNDESIKGIYLNTGNDIAVKQICWSLGSIRRLHQQAKFIIAYESYLPKGAINPRLAVSEWEST